MAASAYLTSPGGGPSISSEQNDEGRALLMACMMTIDRIQMLERRGHFPNGKIFLRCRRLLPFETISAYFCYTLEV
jgi:hypothetical protein